MASITQRCGNWSARTCFKRVRKSATFNTKADAERWAAAQVINSRTRPNLKMLLRYARPKRIAAVYFLFEGGCLIYVGQTSDLHRRLCRHRETLGAPFDHFSFIECGSLAERLDVEAHYIREYLPRINRRLYITDAPRLPIGRAERKAYAMETANAVISKACTVNPVPFLGTKA